MTNPSKESAASNRSPKRLIVVGAAEHGLVVAEAATAGGEYELVGFIDEDRTRRECLGIAPLLGGNQDLTELIERHRVGSVVVAIGDNYVRKKVTDKLRGFIPKNVVFSSIVHPSAVISPKSKIGQGAVILAGAVVGVEAEVGAGCLINTGASLDHHGVLEDYASLGPGVTLGGRVRVGEGAAVAIGATVLHGRSVGAWSVVGAGSVVVKDVRPAVVSYGVPAREKRKRNPEDKYLD